MIQEQGWCTWINMDWLRFSLYIPMRWISEIPAANSLEKQYENNLKNSYAAVCS